MARSCRRDRQSRRRNRRAKKDSVIRSCRAPDGYRLQGEVDRPAAFHLLRWPVTRETSTQPSKRLCLFYRKFQIDLMFKIYCRAPTCAASCTSKAGTGRSGFPSFAGADRSNRRWRLGGCELQPLAPKPGTLQAIVNPTEIVDKSRRGAAMSANPDKTWCRCRSFDAGCRRTASAQPIGGGIPINETATREQGHTRLWKV